MSDSPLNVMHRRTRIAPVVLCALAIVNLFLLTATEVRAQASGILTGVVTAEDASPLRLARVSIAGTQLNVVTEPDGTFRLLGVPAGVHTIEVKLLGYSPLALPVEVLGGESLYMKLLLTANPVTLAAVEVRGDSGMTPLMKGFMARKARGNGTFLDRDQIAAMQPRSFTDVLRRVAGIQIHTGIERYGGGGVVEMGRNSRGMLNRTCPVVYYLNGSPFPMTGDGQNGSINHFIAPEEVVGVEVYSGTAQIPQQFNSGMYNTRCGVVVIWTRSGPEKREPRR